MKTKFKVIFIQMVLFFTVSAQNFCMRFYGHGTGDIDRVKIPIDVPEKPVDIGNGDFTIEFEMKALLTDNPKGANAQNGANDDWTLGHVIIDRDIFGQGDYGDFGISLCNGKIAFGSNNGSQSRTLIGNTNVANNQWNHIAVTRQASNGAMYIYVNGTLDASVATGPGGNISYRNGRTTSWPNDPYLVLGAEKHDYDNNNYPSYNGHIDELRISNNIRYSGSSFTPPAMPFNPDANTVGLYHFDEGSGSVLIDASGYAGGPSNGQVNFGGSGTPGPVWVARTTTSLQENYLASVSVYPNPVYKKHFFIYGLNSSEHEEIQILNLQSGSKILFKQYFLKNNVSKIELDEVIVTPLLIVIKTESFITRKILLPGNE